MKKRHTIMVTAMVIGSLTTIASVALAAGGGGNGFAITTGNCSGRSDWKLKVKPDDGRLELEFEVDSNINGQTWSLRIQQNGSRIFTGARITQGPSGSFDLVRRPSDSAGSDRFLARATNRSTGETCVGKCRSSRSMHTIACPRPGGL